MSPPHVPSVPTAWLCQGHHGFRVRPFPVGAQQPQHSITRGGGHSPRKPHTPKQGVELTRASEEPFLEPGRQRRIAKCSCRKGARGANATVTPS